MAKAGTFGKQPIRRDGTSASLKDYTGLLGVVAAGVLGMSLLCITSAIAISNPDPSNPIVLEPASIVDLAISNLNTVSALTVQAVAISIESTPTLFSTDTSVPASPTLTSSAFPTSTRVQPTNTRRPRPTSTSTRVPPTNTPKLPANTPFPTNTLIPSPTNTPIPIPTTPTISYPTATDPPTPVDTPTSADPPTPVDTPTSADPPTPVDTATGGP